MKRILVILFIVIFSIKPSIGSARAEAEFADKDSLITALKISNLKKKKTGYLIPGIEIKYWTDSKQNGDSGSGIIEEITEEGLKINGAFIPFDEIIKIKKRETQSKRNAKTISLILLGIGIAFGLYYGRIYIVFYPFLKLIFPNITFIDWIPGGDTTIALYSLAMLASIIVFISLLKPQSINLTKHKKYKFETVSISQDLIADINNNPKKYKLVR